MEIKNQITRKLGRTGLKLKAKSPTILFCAGIAGVVGGSVMACRATLKLPEKIEDFEREVNDAKTKKYKGESELDKRDMTYLYLRHSIDIAVLYGPAIITGGLGIVCLVTSHQQLNRRNEALTAAYAALHTAYENYRERVREEVGEEKELDLYRGIETQQIQDDEGRFHEVAVADPTKLSAYARFFDEASRHWQPDNELNRLWIECQQTHANNMLIARGYVFLNEVYESLGLEWSSAGQAVGWLLNGEGDNYIDFGLYNVNNRRFVNGIEPVILLDFNVDGTIIDKI